MSPSDPNRYSPSVLPRFFVGVLLWVLHPGCTPETKGPAPESTLAKETTSDVPSALPEGDTWDVVYLQGAKVGYAHVRRRRIEEDGRPLIQMDQESRLRLTRFDQMVELKIRITSIETLEGALMRFESETTMGPTPLLARGHVDGARLIVETTTAGNTETISSAWSSDNGGFNATEKSLARRPMTPGENRVFDCLVPLFPTPARVTLVARDFQTTELREGSYELLRIDGVTTLPDGSELKEQLWTDRTGDVRKTRVPGIGIESFRTTREIALDEAEEIGAPFDLGVASMVRLAAPLAHAHEARRIRYRVRLKESDPAGVFVSAPGQIVKAIDAHTAELILNSTQTDQVASARTAADRDPTDADREPNSLIQSDDPRIVAMAKEAVGELQDRLSAARAIERYVHDVVRSKNFSQAFATAAEVAATREGDCTEHAVLLAALARASGIPARVAIGLVYVESAQAFGYHMWNELYVDGRWLSMDGTLGRQGIGAAHLKLAHSNLNGSTAFSCFLPVAEVLGQLEIEVLEVE